MSKQFARRRRGEVEQGHKEMDDREEEQPVGVVAEGGDLAIIASFRASNIKTERKDMMIRSRIPS